MDWGTVIGAGAWVPLLAASVRLSAPIAVAAAGECITQRSGTLNLGLEGMMLSGALGSFLMADATGSLLFGTAAGAAVGAVVGLLVGYLVLHLAVDQVVVGIAIVILAGGSTTFAYVQIYRSGAQPQLDHLDQWRIPALHDLPGVGSVLFAHTWPTYLGLVVVLVLWMLLFRSRFGLNVIACGDDPGAAEANGIGVRRTRWQALLLGGFVAGFAGAMLVADVSVFRPNLTAGRGWIAIALVIIARWHPLGALAASGMFGFTNALQVRIQAASGGISSDVPYEIFQALPYVVTFVVVVIVTLTARRRAQPSALGASWSGS